MRSSWPCMENTKRWCRMDKDKQKKNTAANLERTRLQLLGSPFRHEDVPYGSYHSGHPLYDTMAALCEVMKIRICSYQSLEAGYGEKYTPYDIARMSHFTLREIALEPGWYKRDGGAFLGYIKGENGEEKRPVLLVPGRRRYMLYDLTGENAVKVNGQVAESIEAAGFMAYRPLKDGRLTFRDILAYALASLRGHDLVTIALLSVLSVLIGFLLPLLTGLLFDRLIPLADTDAVWEIGTVFAAAALGNLFFLIVRNLAMMRVSKGMEYTVISGTMDRLVHLPQNFLSRYGSADLVGRVMGLAGVIPSVTNGFFSAVLGLFFAVFYGAMMFTWGSALAGRAIAMVLLTCLVIHIFGYQRLRWEREKLEQSNRAGAVLYQYLSGIMKVRLSGIEERTLLEYQKQNTAAVRSEIKSTKFANMAETVYEAAQILYPCVLYYAILRGQISITVGQFSAFSTAFGMFSASASQVFNFFLVLGGVIPACQRAGIIYEEETEQGKMTGGAGRIQGNIEADHLVFCYEGEQKPVLKDVSFKIPAGSFVGIVGTSGCGKSTLLKCLLGFEQPQSGKIYYDNRDINTLDKRELRRQLGVVLQEGRLSSGTIYSNIEIAVPGIEPEEVEALMEEVGMREDIRQMPMGIFTEVSELGGTISGGQQQRILIARALANRPSVLFFDEATSALDNVAQEKVCESMEKRQITRVMIAHRLSTVKNCDRILVMQDGRITEQGNYEELMAQKGLFWQLARRQQA